MASPGWRNDDIGRRLQHLVDTARTTVAVLPDRRDPAAVAVTPLLRVWWPSWPPPYALATAAAVEHLRLTATHPA